MCVRYPVNTVDLQYKPSSHVPGERNVFSEENDVVKSRAYNLNVSLLHHWPPHLHLLDTLIIICIIYKQREVSVCVCV